MSRAAPVIQAAWEAVFAGLSGAAAFVVKQHQGGACGPQHRALADLGGRPSSSRAPTPSTNDYGSAEAWNPPFAARLEDYIHWLGAGSPWGCPACGYMYRPAHFVKSAKGPDVP